MNKRVKLVIIVLLVVVIAFEGFIMMQPKKVNGMFDKNKNFKKELTTAIYKSIKINPNDSEAVELLNKAKNDSSYAFILKHYDEIPHDLIVKLNANDECKDYVINYLAKSKKDCKKIVIKNNVPYLSQYDSRWGYDIYGDQMIGINGCGPTCLSMVAMYFNKNTSITPKVVAEMSVKRNYYVPHVGSSWALMIDGAKQYDLKSENVAVTKENIIKALKKGEKIIISVKPGYFTRTGHFMVLRGLNKSGQVLINDPDSYKNTKKAWDIDYIVSQGRTMWCIKK